MGHVIRIAIGVDYRESPGYHVACHSIMKRASQPLAFYPIALNNVVSVHDRARNNMQATQFSFSRFIAPYLCDYEGWIIFMDSDVVVLDDVAKLWALRDDRYAVMCVKHDHRPANETKFLGATQTQYPKKNWSSVMLMNAARCRALTPEYVNMASGLDLHRFNWLESEDLIGEIPARWNHLVGYSPGELADQSLLHYTEGGPYFAAYRDSKWADVWFDAYKDATTVVEKHLAEV